MSRNSPVKTPKKHLILPDCQVKPGVPTEHLSWIGQYIVEKQPDVIVCIGDFADLCSLSSYDVGKKSFEGRRYNADIESAKAGMELLVAPMREFNKKRNQQRRYKPRMVMTLGNHEERILRAVENDPKLDGTIGMDDLGYKEAGWEVHDFLKIVEIDGISYVHYVTTGAMGRPCASAQVALREVQGSVVQGHVQHHDLAIHKKSQQFGLFSGTCYLHEEKYLGAQGNSHKPGIWMLHEVDGTGNADLMFVSLNFLRRKYG